jgi:transposase
MNLKLSPPGGVIGKGGFISKQQRYTEEFKIEAVKQVTARQHQVAAVADRLGVSGKIMYGWIKRYNTRK